MPGIALVDHDLGATRIFAALAEFERALVVERTKAGLEVARARGRDGRGPFKMAPAKLRLARTVMG